MIVTLKHPVVKVLITRDGIGADEAIELVEQGICYIAKATSLSEAEDILADDFGLEPDYLSYMMEI